MKSCSAEIAGLLKGTTSDTSSGEVARVLADGLPNSWFEGCTLPPSEEKERSEYNRFVHTP